MKLFLLYFSLCLSLFACKKNEDEGVYIRIRNISAYPFATTYVNTPGGDNQYGALSPAQNSDYHAFTKAYRYAYLKASVQGQDLVLQPYDYVGEQPLEPGHYTYIVNVETNPTTKVQYLTISLTKP